jgi:hypothetical protein
MRMIGELLLVTSWCLEYCTIIGRNVVCLKLGFSVDFY